MRVDMVRYHIMAALGIIKTAVKYSNQPTTPANVITVYAEGDRNNVHSGVIVSSYMAIIRNAVYITGEAQARAVYNAVQDNFNRELFDGVFLTGAMSATSDPVSFAPDDGAAVDKSTLFTVGDYILIDSEILQVTIVSAPNVTADRAQLGTTKAAHLNNAEVYNITQSPIPGETCDFSVATSGVESLGQDEKNRQEFSVNWEVTVKP